MSGHAFDTVRKNAMTAKNIGLELIAITDHGPAIAGAPGELYFMCGKRMPRIRKDLKN